MTGPRGCVKGCQSSYGRGSKVYRVPAISMLYQRNQWLQNAGMTEDQMPKDARFCEAHFTPDQFERLNAQGSVGLKSNAVPTLFGNNPPMPLPMDADADPEFQDGNEVPGPCSPLANRNQIYLNQNEPLTPISKRRKAYSMCEDNTSEIDRLRDSLNNALKEARTYKRMAVSWKKKCANLGKNLRTFLNEDQVDLLQLEDYSHNNKAWSDQTIKTALQIRLMVKAKGYEFLRVQMKWPLPSFATLKKRLQTLEFSPGPNSEILKYLPGVVINPEEPGSELCWLSWDEAAIEEGVAYEKGLKQCLGFVTPELARNDEEKNSLAQKVVVFGLRGLRGYWKQLISYGFSGQNIEQSVLWNYLSALIIQAHAVGLKVRGISNDQGVAQ